MNAKKKPFGKRFINHPATELVFAGLIFFNALCMGLEQQYYSLDVAYRLQLTGSTQSAEDTWPYAERTLVAVEFGFGVAFTLEVILKIAIYRRDFHRSWWNLYDSAIISCWLIQSLDIFSVFMPPMVLRLVRAGRLLRLLRFAKAFQVFDVLHLLVRSLLACMTALMWSALFLLIVMMGAAILMVYMLQAECENEAIPLEGRLQLYSYFGSFTRGFFSLYELTMGNPIPISRAVIEHVSEWYMIVFILYRTFVGFAVLKVVTAIFNAETFRVTQTDDDIMLMHKERQIAIHAKRMQQLLLEGDDSQDGYLNMEEFQNLLADKRVKKWLLAQEVEVHHVRAAFEMIDASGDGRICPEELVRGIARLKGSARSVDVLMLMDKLSGIEALVHELEQSRSATAQPF
eukprot:TRINITY_DN9697_c0_g1_i1.p1 TRINITY_DN9697_c0_g1~~TRINITY_DN9697_c0_g1_i1.p1  ORF type:complete len:402 (-),score=64.15 TRINITY_DN9697_c0_g1_i1:73-1278(-)